MNYEIWQPTMQLRWNHEGKLQQQWSREVREWRAYNGIERVVTRVESEFRDVPTEPTGS